MKLLCPVCARELNMDSRPCRCGAGHSFDAARQGYVNLLPVQQKHSLNPGDTRDQVASRREFLSAGFYRPIADALCTAAAQFGAEGPILDVGCGEGYYSSILADAMGAELVGIDISKEAVRRAAGTYKNGLWLCATAAKLPVADGQAGLITSLFALTVPGEFHRCLKEKGLFFQVLAAEDHLLSLKSIIYPELKCKEKDTVPAVAGFELVNTVPISFPFTVEGPQVQNLLSMTPHVYRISAAGAAALAATEKLTDRASCVLNVYRRMG